MKHHASKIGAFEAKTHLAELLRQAQTGRSFVIHRRGKPIARLVPPATEPTARVPSDLLAAFRAIRRRIRGPIRVRTLVDAGRRR